MLGRINRPRRGVPPTHLDHVRQTEGRDFVEAGLSVHHHRPHRTECRQRIRQQREAPPLRDADHLTPRAGRIGEWAHDVHDGRYRQLTTDRADMAECGVH